MLYTDGIDPLVKNSRNLVSSVGLQKYFLPISSVHQLKIFSSDNHRSNIDVFCRQFNSG
jgi:hypothetical protein